MQELWRKRGGGAYFRRGRISGTLRQRPNIAAKRLVLDCRRRKANRLSKPSSVIDLTSAANPTSRKKSKAPKTWVQNNLYSLSVAAKERILSPTDWLTDDIIEASQCLIQENNPLVEGLQPPYLGQTCSFTIETGKYIQVVHNGADHWLVVTNIGVPTLQKQVSCFNLRVVTMVADKLKRQWL